MQDEHWPPLSLDSWRDTYATLHLWTQVVGKIALALAPPLNHSWGSALHVTPRGLTTQLLQHGTRTFSMEFDFIAHRLFVRTSDGEVRTLELKPQSVAVFYGQVIALLGDLSLPVHIWPVAVELPSPIRLDRDEEHHAYDAAAVHRYWRVLARVAAIFNEVRCGFLGKSSPTHFFWGAFDLAMTRFSGRPAPPREGPTFMQEAYSHEVISHGFWPGSGPVQEPAFYAYAAPEPAGLSAARVLPDAAYYHRELGEFILPYEAVRQSTSPERAIREFVDSTYAAAAALANWDRAALERRLP